MIFPFASARGQSLEKREADAALELAGDDGGVEGLRLVAIADDQVGRRAEAPSAEEIKEGEIGNHSSGKNRNEERRAHEIVVRPLYAQKPAIPADYFPTFAGNRPRYFAGWTGAAFVGRAAVEAGFIGAAVGTTASPTGTAVGIALARAC